MTHRYNCPGQQLLMLGHKLNDTIHYIVWVGINFNLVRSLYSCKLPCLWGRLQGITDSLSSTENLRRSQLKNHIQNWDTWTGQTGLSNYIPVTVTGVEEITPEQSSPSLTTSLKLCITQMNDRSFGLIGPRQVHASIRPKPRSCIWVMKSLRVMWSVTWRPLWSYLFYFCNSIVHSL